MGNAPKPKKKPLLFRSFDPNMWLYQRWFPEALHAERGSDRNKLWQICWWRAWQAHWLRFGGLMFLLPLGAIAEPYLATRVNDLLRTQFAIFIIHGILDLLMSIGFAIVWGVATFGVMSSEVRRELRLALRARGIMLCIKCGYDLRGQVTPRCPECGTAIDLPLSKSEELSTR